MEGSSAPYRPRDPYFNYRLTPNIHTRIHTQKYNNKNKTKKKQTNKQKTANNTPKSFRFHLVE